MAHLGRSKRRGVGVTGITLRGRWNMRAGLTLGGDAVAACATTGDRWCNQGVIKDRTGKGREALGMANIALQTRDRMLGRLTQSTGCRKATTMAT